MAASQIRISPLFRWESVAYKAMSRAHFAAAQLRRLPVYQEAWRTPMSKQYALLKLLATQARCGAVSETQQSVFNAVFARADGSLEPGPKLTSPRLLSDFQRFTGAISRRRDRPFAHSRPAWNDECS